MSALFDSGNGVLTTSSEMPVALELRSVPFVQQISVNRDQPTWLFNYTIDEKSFSSDLGDLVWENLQSLSKDWMYTAIIHTALEGPKPVWSQDDWSFMPVSSGVESFASAEIKSPAGRGNRSVESLRVQTSAIRARLECSAVEWPRNTSLWLLSHNDGYGRNITGLDNYFTIARVVDDRNSTTWLSTQGSIPPCCANLTGNATYNPAAVAYWTENWQEVSGPEDSRDYRTSGNFTVKWIRGPGKIERFLTSMRRKPDVYMFVFPEPPAIQALNCMPIFESSQAVVTVEPKTGVVQHYRLLDVPVREDVAWSDTSQWRDPYEDARYTNFNIHHDPDFEVNSSEWRASSFKSYDYNINTTTSYGPLFVQWLLNAANIDGPSSKSPPRTYENSPRPNPQYSDGRAFNMRDNTTGLNLDFMSYAAYAQVGFDPTALLDPEVLARTSSTVFSTFFQHFVNSNLSRESGGYVYQPRGMELKINAPMDDMPIQYMPDGSIAPKFEDIVRNTNATTTAELSTKVEVLQMNLVAFWIATSILIWLIITIIILGSVQRKYYGGMMRNIECIADVLVLIAGSERLLEVIREKGFDAIVKEDKMLTRMGWFRDVDGTMRWRIDLVEEKQVQTQPIRLGPGYVPVTNDNEECDVDAGSSRSVSPPGSNDEGYVDAVSDAGVVRSR
ncbi:uncharacterized protein J4E79_011687 [Alternaria viburni]|uniref:uncharacterized protein n=1 Tax=Alternaria viburni TaxID=566460 RepID=UPI0020C21DE9|nr:uncharacterized protein J4E79_011687 [Alternaria viburni]KAI4641480.1 hypothetical protein J4E79_011687 [Alternaria viburni]